MSISIRRNKQIETDIQFIFRNMLFHLPAQQETQNKKKIKMKMLFTIIELFTVMMMPDFASVDANAVPPCQRYFLFNIINISTFD